MLIRPIRPGELETFAALPGQPERNAQVRKYLIAMIAAGSMRPEWCFVAEQDGQTVGCIAYWTLPDGETPSDFVLLEAPWDGDYMPVGRDLLRQTLDRMRNLGAQALGHVVDSPSTSPQWQYFEEQRIRLLKAAGFVLARETLRFERRAGEPIGSRVQRLTYRPLPEVGSAAFVDAIQQVATGSLDRWDQQTRADLGRKAAAHAMFDIVTGLDHDERWWELAYTSEGELVGLVMPARTSTAHTIGYIGVTPTMRGQGYIDDLLARCATTLSHAGAHRIQIDTDTRNTPMANAFRRAGYIQFTTRRTYNIHLAGQDAGP